MRRDNYINNFKRHPSYALVVSPQNVSNYQKLGLEKVNLIQDVFVFGPDTSTHTPLHPPHPNDVLSTLREHKQDWLWCGYVWLKLEFFFFQIKAIK